jgi:hypothetical protein
LIAPAGGSFETPSESSTGVFVARRTSFGPAPLEVTAAFAGEDAVAASCQLETPPAPPSAIDVTADRVTAIAGSGAIPLRITPRYGASARELAIDSITLQSDAGTVSTPVRDADGTWTATWHVAEQIGDRRQARLTAHASLVGTSVRGELVIALAPAAAAHLSALVPTVVRADGRAEHAVPVRLVDRFGNPVDSTPIEVWRGQQRIATVSSATPHFSYTPPRSHEAGDDTLILRAPGVESRAVVRLAPLPGPYEVSAHAGVVSNFGRVMAPMLRLDGGAFLPVLGDRISAHVSAGLYSNELDGSSMSESLSARLTVVPLLGNVAYHASVASFDVRAGAGLGVALTWSRVTSASTGMQREHAVPFAATAFLGAARALGPGRIVGDVAYLHASLDGMLAGRAGGLATTVGYALDLR